MTTMKRRTPRQSTAAEPTVWDRLRDESQDIETEEYFLGAWMRQCQEWALFEACQVPPEAFSGAHTAAIHRGILRCTARGVPPDDDAVRRELITLGEMDCSVRRVDISRIMECVPRLGEASIGEKGYVLRKLWLVRRYGLDATRGAERILDDFDSLPVVSRDFAARLQDLAQEQPTGRLGVPLPEFVRDSDDGEPAPMLIADLLPGDGITLVHGQPRTRKTLCIQAVLLALASGRAAFDCERFQVACARPVLYITQEDAVTRVRERFAALAAGLGLDCLPELLHVAAHSGFDFDDPAYQERLITETRSEGYALVGFDPLRSLTAVADQGPAELKPLAKYLRRFQHETKAAACIVHHDTKPPTNGKDARARPQRASGGGIFSIADAPIHVDALDGRTSLIVPTAWKFGADPAPFVLRLESDGPEHPRCLRFNVQSVDARNAGDMLLHSKIVEYLCEREGCSGSAIAKGIHANKAQTLSALERLATLGRVDRHKGPKNSHRWTLTTSESA